MEEMDPTPTSRKKVLIPIFVLLALVVGALMAIKASVTKESHLQTQRIELQEGREVPDFDLVDLTGAKVNLSSLSSKVKMINFWASWCEACMVEMPSIVKLREKYHAQGFEVLGINVDENPKEVVPSIAQKFQIKFPLYIDQAGALSGLFDVHAIPLTVLIDEDKKILFVETGERDWFDEEMQKMLEQWLQK